VVGRLFFDTFITASIQRPATAGHSPPKAAPLHYRHYTYTCQPSPKTGGHSSRMPKAGLCLSDPQTQLVHRWNISAGNGRQRGHNVSISRRELRPRSYVTFLASTSISGGQGCQPRPLALILLLSFWYAARKDPTPDQYSKSLTLKQTALQDYPQTPNPPSNFHRRGFYIL
jgi:hypothetical protein